MNLLLTLVQLLPSILAAIKSVEDIVGAGNGQTKKQIVLAAVEAAVKGGEKIPNAAIAGISGLIDTVVGLLNASGVLSPGKGTPTPTPTPNA